MPAAPAKRLLRFAIAGAVLYFAIEGGEYGTSDLLSQRARKARVTAEIEALERQIDSLAEYRQRLARDPALQERIAREQFGMVRGNKELLYRFVDPPAPERREKP